MVKDQEYLEKKASYCLDLAKKLGPLYNKYQMIGLPSPVAIQLAPPISVTKDEIDDLVERVENVIKDLS